MERIQNISQQSKPTSMQQDTSVLNMGPGKSNQEDLPEQLEVPFTDEAGGDSGG